MCGNGFKAKFCGFPTNIHTNIHDNSEILVPRKFLQMAVLQNYYTWADTWLGHKIFNLLIGTIFRALSSF